LIGGDIWGRIEKSIEIKAPPEKVWEMFAFDRHPEWNEEYKSAEYTSEVRTSEDKYRVGASAHITSKQEEIDVEITESLENEKISFSVRGVRGAQNIIGTFTLKPTEAGTEMTCVMDYELPWSILGKILDKLFVQRALEKDTERSLEKLKSILEK